MSAAGIILNVGLEGSFELAPPFTNLIRANTRYTIRSIRSMSEMISDGEDPQAIYNAVQVPEADYLRDLRSDANIIRLQSTSDEWVNVPQSYIVSLPSMDGVSYRPLAIVAPLGVTADDLELGNLTAALDALIMAHLGVQATSVITEIGAAELVTQAEHTRIKAERAARVTYSESEAAKMVRLERENAELRTANAELADYIRKTA